MQTKTDLLENTLQRIVYFLFIYSILLILLYLLGNYQYFLEQTQYTFLKLLEITSLFGVILGFYCLSYNAMFFIVITIYKLPVKKNIHKIAINLLMIFLNIIIFIFLKMLVVWFSSY